jgi:hypothetical protein
MPELEPLIERPGVIGISDTNRTDKTGRWHVLVTEEAFKTIRKSFTAKIATWANALPESLLSEIPPEFPLPSVYQKNGYEGDDDSSSGQDSYMSSCAQSYGSFDETNTDEEYYSPPGRSYASVLSGYRDPPVAERIKEVRIPAKSKPNHATISSIQATAKIAILEEEIKSLRTLIKGAQTPSTVTETSAPDKSSQDDRITNIEANMAMMTSQFSNWMSELRQRDVNASNITTLATTAQPPQPSESLPSNQKTDRLEETTPTRPTRHQSKRIDNRTTPERRALLETEAMQVELFPDDTGLVTQPLQSLTAPDDFEGISPSPSPPASPTMMEMLEAASSPQYPDDYDTDEPMYRYTDNGDGTLFCIGLAQPADFDSAGIIRGPQPTASQIARTRGAFQELLLQPSLTHRSEVLVQRPLSPENTLATQDETVMSSATSSPQGQPPCERISPTPMMGPLPSLPAEGALSEN